ncbi:kelch domain-containing protein 1 isoform X2 [Chelonoidis abingdonii]|uniref:kelch domain-containing protein 1 isoform X2 n=1 Tax=Chelonoidis abingdonii TaxID=106734 RepID=UPI0013F284B1|nr:kelch domain-containing protein 1 isoform X2 [Chelonoidis abingdonii]
MAARAPASQQFCVAEERSGHCAVVDGNFLYVWGGYVSIEENEVYLPNDELWLYEIDSGLWTMHLMEGELPTSMSGSCGACINGKLYIFGGFDDKGYSNLLYYVNLRTRNGTYRWKKITDFKGQPPTPRDKLSCWVYKDRLIYFGGYGCRKYNELSDCFDVHDAFWGGVPPQPRAAHTCAVLGNKGYIFGGRVLQTRMNDLHCLNLDTWIWSGRIHINGEKPKDRSWHTLTPIADDKLFLFGGLSSDNVPLSDGWIHSVTTNGWKQLTHLPKSRPRLWHTACLGTEGEVMIFGGSKDDLHFLDTGHCSDLLIFQTQPYSLLRLCLDCIGKNATLLKNQISWLPSKILPQVLKKITFWAAANHRQEKKAEIERQEQINVT